MSKQKSSISATANSAAKKSKEFWSDFKKFITKGNVVDMAVGVIIGGAFNAIVTALVSILLSVCTWGVPGGLKGLVTVLPAANSAQAGMDAANGLDQTFAANDLQGLAADLADRTYGSENVTPALIEQMKTTILSKYTLHGTNYFYNASAIIDWGTFINAIISFLIIGFTLFVIVRVIKKIQAKNAEYQAKVRDGIAARMASGEKVTAEEAAQVAPAPAPGPTEMDVLIQIRDELKKQNAASNK